jgi:diaminopimelate decarboxylase
MRIEQRMQWLSELAGPLSISALMAVKSCPDPRYLGAAYKHLDGFDISNSAEYACLPENLEGKLVSVTSPALNLDINSFVAKGNTAVITLYSHTQLEHYFSHKPRIPYLLRVQGSDLLEEADPSHYARIRFGFTLDEVRQLVQQPQLRENPPAGFHVHHGNEKNTASTYRSIIEALKPLAQQQAVDPRLINLGGGWHSVNREEMGGVLAEARSAFPAPCSIVLEPGRWYGKNSGFAVGTIVNQTRSGDTVQYVVDLSKDCHLN